MKSTGDITVIHSFDTTFVDILWYCSIVDRKGICWWLEVTVGDFVPWYSTLGWWRLIVLLSVDDVDILFVTFWWPLLILIDAFWCHWLLLVMRWYLLMMCIPDDLFYYPVFYCIWWWWYGDSCLMSLILWWYLEGDAMFPEYAMTGSFVTHCNSVVACGGTRCIVVVLPTCYLEYCSNSTFIVIGSDTGILLMMMPFCHSWLWPDIWKLFFDSVCVHSGDDSLIQYWVPVYSEGSLTTFCSHYNWWLYSSTDDRDDLTWRLCIDVWKNDGSDIVFWPVILWSLFIGIMMHCWLLLLPETDFVSLKADPCRIVVVPTLPLFWRYTFYLHSGDVLRDSLLFCWWFDVHLPYDLSPTDDVRCCVTRCYWWCCHYIGENVAMEACSTVVLMHCYSVDAVMPLAFTTNSFSHIVTICSVKFVLFDDGWCICCLFWSDDYWWLCSCCCFVLCYSDCCCSDLLPLLPTFVVCSIYNADI